MRPHQVSKLLLPSFLICISIGLLGCTATSDERSVVTKNSDASAHENLTPDEPDEDVLVVDEETRSPEGSAHATSTIYVRSGDEYKSTCKSIPKAVVEEVRKIALSSESKQKPDLKDFGITEESVHKNQGKMIVSAETWYMSHKATYKDLENLPPELKKLFDYETVSNNALLEITGALNSAYDCVRFSLPGNPRITLLSRHRQSGMLPWLVQAGERRWTTYSRELPVALAKLATSKSASFLSEDNPDFRFQDPLHPKRGGYWPNGFFEQYSVWSRDQVESHKSQQSAKQLPGWPEVSKVFTLVDAKSYNGGSMVIQAATTSPDSVISEMRWDAHPERNEPDELHNWNELLEQYKLVETAVKSSTWMSKWKAAKPNRTILSISEDGSSWSDAERNRFAKTLGITSPLVYKLRLMERGIHIRDVFLSKDGEQALVTDLGPYTESTDNSPSLRPTSSRSPVLWVDESSEPELNQRICAFIDESGRVIKQTQPPSNYALRSNYPPASAEDEKFNYSWPVDFSKQEDLEYIGNPVEGEEPIEAFGYSRDDDDKQLYGVVNNEGKILIPPKWKWLGPFSNGLASVVDLSGKSGYVDEKGALVVSPQYDESENFYEGLAAVRKSGKWGFIDTKGSIAIPLVYDSVRRFSEGVAPARKGFKFGYIDKAGKWAITPQFNRARHFQNGLAYVQIDGKRAYIDHSGKPIGGKYYKQLERFSEDKAQFSENGPSGFIDRQGRVVIPARFADADAFRDGVALVYDNGEQKAIDASGKFVNMPPKHQHKRADNNIKPVIHGRKFSEVFPLHNGMALVRSALKYGYVNAKGDVVFEPQFDSAHQFNERGLAVVGMLMKPKDKLLLP